MRNSWVGVKQQPLTHILKTYTVLITKLLICLTLKCFVYEVNMHLRLKVKFKLKFNLSSCHTFLVIVQFCMLLFVIQWLFGNIYFNLIVACKTLWYFYGCWLKFILCQPNSILSKISGQMFFFIYIYLATLKDLLKKNVWDNVYR